MPAPRELSLVTCSCGKRIGDLRRAESADEDVEAVEMAALRATVPVLLKHWKMGHDLAIHPRAPIAVKAVVAKAAREFAGDAGPDEKALVKR